MALYNYNKCKCNDKQNKKLFSRNNALGCIAQSSLRIVLSNMRKKNQCTKFSVINRKEKYITYTVSNPSVLYSTRHHFMQTILTLFNESSLYTTSPYFIQPILTFSNPFSLYLNHPHFIQHVFL